MIGEAAVTGSIGAAVAVAVIGVLTYGARAWIGTQIQEAIRLGYRKELEEYRHDLRVEENALLEELRKLNSQLQAIQGAANSAFVEGQRVSAEWRIRAVDAFWQQWVEELQETPLEVRLWDSSWGTGVQEALLQESSFVALARGRSRDVDRAIEFDMDRHRPFVGDEPCSLLRVYRTVAAFISLRMSQHVAGENTDPWFADESILSLVRIALSESEFEQFLSRKNGHLLLLQKAIEKNLTSGLRKIISGEIATDESLEQGLRIFETVQGIGASGYRADPS